MRRLTLLDRDRLIREGVETVPGPVAARLLDAIMATPDERADLNGRLHEDHRSRAFAELLIDLEEDRQLALDFAQALKERPVQQED